MKIIDGDYVETQGYGWTDYALAHPDYYKGYGGVGHAGRDYAPVGGVRGLNALSLIAGPVTKTGYNSGDGNYVEILGSDGWIRKYGHLKERLVHKGDEVIIGSPIGIVGSTGNSTGVHTHYMHKKWTWKGWEYRDPIIDFEEEQPVAELPQPLTLIKGSGPRVYFYDGEKRYHIPNMNTLTKVFGSDVDLTTIDDAILGKMVDGARFPVM